MKSPPLRASIPLVRHVCCYPISQAEQDNPEPDNRSSVFYTKRRVLLELKDDAQARAAFEQSIQQDPKGHFAQLSQQQLDRCLSARSVAK